MSSEGNCVWKGRQGARKEGKEQDEYVSKFCCSLTYRIILEFPSEPETSVRLWTAWKMGVETIKSTCLHLYLYHPFFSAAKSAVVIPRRKFRFASFFEYFEAVPYLLLANCSLPLHHLECLNYFTFRNLQCEVKWITVGRNIEIYDIFCCPHQMSHSSVNLTPSWNMSSDSSTMSEFRFLKQTERFLPSVVFNIILLS